MFWYENESNANAVSVNTFVSLRVAGKAVLRLFLVMIRKVVLVGLIVDDRAVRFTCHEFVSMPRCPVRENKKNGQGWNTRQLIALVTAHLNNKVAQHFISLFEVVVGDGEIKHALELTESQLFNCPIETAFYRFLSFSATVAQTVLLHTSEKRE